MDLSHKDLEVMVNGKPADPSVSFFENAVLDVDASKQAGRRIYRDQVMIKRQVPGVTDYVAQRATAQDVRRWPSEYQLFQQAIQRRKSPGLEVLFGISNAERQECIDRGYSTVELLANAEDLPAHLAHLQPKARRIQLAIQAEEYDHDQEESNEEGSGRDAETALPRAPIASQRFEPVFEVPGRDDRSDVIEREAPQVRPEQLERGAGGYEEGRREHSAPRLNNIDNWKVELVWRP